MLNRTKLLNKLRLWILNGKDGEPCRTLALFHMSAEGASKPVESWTVNPESSIEELSIVIGDTVETDAEGWSDKQTYSLCAYFGIGSPIPDAQNGGGPDGYRASRGVQYGAYGARHTMTVVPAPDFEDNDPGSPGSSDISSTKAMTNVAMNYALKLQGAVLPAMDRLMSKTMSVIERLEAQNNSLMDEQRKNVIMREKLMSENQKRALEMRQQIWMEARKEEVINAFTPILMTGIQQLVTGDNKPLPAGPAAPGADNNDPENDEVHLFVSFAGMITEYGTDMSRIGALQAVLTPMQLLPLGKIFQDLTLHKKAPDRNILFELAKTFSQEQCDKILQIVGPESHAVFVKFLAVCYSKYEARQDEMKRRTDEAMKDVASQEQEPPDPLGEDPVK